MSKRIKESKVFSPEDFLSRPQVAEILGVCKTTITTAIDRGWLETVVIGTRHYVLKETLENVVVERKIARRLGIGEGD
jgi:hypothetical protein